MAEYAPKAIYAMYGLVKPHEPSMEISGIIGNGAHSYGYHRSRNHLRAVGRSNDYSIADDPRDRKGDGNAASAIDMKFNPAAMIRISKRLIAAGKANDPRLKAMREFFGTTDGKTVDGYSPFRHRKVVSSDKSHLWHIHISITREFCNDEDACADIAAVVAGIPLPKPKPVELPHYWLSYFLDAQSDIPHDRSVRAHGETVIAAERALADFGFDKGPKPDGHYGTSTVENVKAFQALVSPGIEPSGNLGPKEWARLAGGPRDGKHPARFIPEIGTIPEEKKS